MKRILEVAVSVLAAMLLANQLFDMPMWYYNPVELGVIGLIAFGIWRRFFRRHTPPHPPTRVA